MELVDDYAWLRAENWQEVLRDPAALPAEIRTVVEAENAYAETMMAGAAELSAEIAREMRGRLKEDDADLPSPDGPYAYYSRFREGGQHPLVCRQARDGGDERILVDGDARAAGSKFYSVGRGRHAPDHRTHAWSFDDKGSEYYTIALIDIASGDDLPDRIPDTTGGVMWSADSSAFYYVRVDANHRPNRVYRHSIGSDAAADDLVFEETDHAWFVSVGPSRSGRFGRITVSDHDSAEVHLVDLHRPDARPRILERRRPGVLYDVADHGDRLIILTNAGDAEDFAIVESPIADPCRENWRDLVPHVPGRMIVSYAVFAEYVVRVEREQGLPRIVIRHIASGEEHSISFEEEAYSLGLEPMFEFETTTLRFHYSSMTTPEEIFDYDMATRERTLRKCQEIPSGHDPRTYLTRRIHVTAADGASIPVSLLQRRDLVPSGETPLLLYGYGSYGHSVPAAFSSQRLSLVDRGFICAIAHVRGGTDKGRRWYLDGKLAKKRNTFTDFIAVARHLVDAGLTSPRRMVAHGGSAGGLLMGAVVNMAPELFAGAIADVPFVDVLNTILDGDLPLTPPEWLEWGNPITDRVAFDTIRSYSPYDNIAAQRYPTILALAGLTDPRVTYWEAAKWVARLRATMSGGGPIMLKTNMGAGHGGSSGRFDRLDETAFRSAFAVACARGDFAARR